MVQKCFIIPIKLIMVKSGIPTGRSAIIYFILQYVYIRKINPIMCSVVMKIMKSSATLCGTVWKNAKRLPILYIRVLNGLNFSIKKLIQIYFRAKRGNLPSFCRRQIIIPPQACGSDGFPKENGGVSREVRVGFCRRQILIHGEAVTAPTKERTTK